MKVYKIIKNVLLIPIAIVTICCGSTVPVFAEQAYNIFQVSPMNQRISLIPGERYYGTFKVTNPASNQFYFRYQTEIMAFSVNDSYEPDFSSSQENNDDYNQIVDWITIENPEGIIAPNNTEIIRFYVDTPADAPAGGQYASIVVGSTPSDSSGEGINIKAEYSMAHLLYADVAGETIRGGDIVEVAVPSFLFSGNITGTASIKNTGNVHSDATYTLQVFPFFSKEEIYTNEEDPTSVLIFPETTRTTTISWSDTPSLGIFHVIYTASFEGVENTVDKTVIVCPLWLLLLILFLIFLIFFRILWGGKKEKKQRR